MALTVRLLSQAKYTGRSGQAARHAEFVTRRTSMTSAVAATSGFQLSDVGQVYVRAKDLPRAVAFYRDVLSVPFLFEAPGMAFFQCGSLMLMLGTPESPEFDHRSSILYFRVPDIQAAHETLKDRKVSFRGAPHVVHRAGD